MDSKVRLRWEEVCDEEIVQIARRHIGEGELKENLVGLAFSGGGIRSATFGLGVLEGLKQCGLLKKIDYLSTVSGGGYIGAWLVGNCKRAGERRAAGTSTALDIAALDVQKAAIEADEAANKAASTSDAAKKLPAMALAKEKATLKASAEERLATAKARYDRACVDWLDKDADWKDSIAHLRRYSNYLSPKVGFFSADTWSMAAIWIRNTLLVQLTVILTLAVVLLIPRPLFEVFLKWPQVDNWRWMTVVMFILAIAGIAGNQLRVIDGGDIRFLKSKSWIAGLIASLICFAAAVTWGIHRHFEPFTNGPIDWIAAAPIALLLVLTGFCLQPVGVKLMGEFWRGSDPPKQINYTQGWVQTCVVIPLMATGFLVAAILWGQTECASCGLSGLDSYGGFFLNAWRYWPLPLSVACASLWLLSFCSMRSCTDLKGLSAALLSPVPAVMVLYALLCAVMLLLHEWQFDPVRGKWLAFVWTPALVLFAFSVAIVILIGIMGRQSTEAVREWWSRLGAWLGIYGFSWMLISVVAVHGPQFAALILDRETNWKSFSVIGGWVATTLAGLIAGKSNSTGGSQKGAKSEKTNVERLVNVVAVVGPFVFIAGLLIVVSTCLHLIILASSGQSCSGFGDILIDHWRYLDCSDGRVVMAVMGVTFVCLLLLAARVDINEFSLNAFYRSRLSRCYLGATHFLAGERNPQRFTGFDDKDDLHLSDLGGTNGKPAAGPLHIVNCALNLGGSSDLALHTRHSASFTLTAYAVGSGYLSRDPSGLKTADQLGYQRIAEYGGQNGRPTLGQAISVSGAAASPNMGYHTSPVVAFLLTVFNVRLGWWFPNPRNPEINCSSPWFSLRYLFKELFGGADDKSNYLMISDGGHFENLAVYELIKRRCHVIIVSDAECDPDLEFEGLGSLIRMCEVDLRTRITLDVSSIRANPDSGWSKCRYAVGDIEYGEGIPNGVLIYLKASMTGHEDSAVLQYKATHPAFPHESTSDQFYGEDQFESYRRLGREITTLAFDSSLAN